VAEGDCAAEGVEPLGVYAPFLAAGDHLGREGLVELEHVDVAMVIPACSSTALTTGMGPSPMISGRIAATEEAMIRALGVSPFSRAFTRT
jgi:hypothetical protein